VGHRARGTLSRLAAAVLVALVAGVLAAEASISFGPGRTDEVRDARLSAARTARTAMLAGFAATYALTGRRGQPGLARRCGLLPADRAIRTYALGFAAGTIPVIAVIGVLWLLGARTVEVRGDALKLGFLAAKAVGFGLFLVLIEESLFRGLLLGDFIASWGTITGVAACSVFFAATHFLGTTAAWRAEPQPISSGVEAVAALFLGMERVVTEWPELVGLTLVGAILSTLRVRAGTIYLAMGVHAGWYWIKQMDRYFVDEVKAVAAAHRLWIGSEQYVDGVLGWTGLLLSLLVASSVRLPAGDSPLDPQPGRRSEP
jgi:membrane protease YdiL (CAAX protease family)